MENWLYASLPVLIKTVVSCILIFFAIIIIVRIAGLRTFAKMSSFDFASTIAVGTILASTIMNTDQSLLKGAVALASVVALQYAFSYSKRRFQSFSDIVTNEPLLLMKNGEILYDNLARSQVSKSDLLAKLREANVLQMSEVHAVVLETTGDVSVLHGKDQQELDDVLLSNVRIKLP